MMTRYEVTEPNRTCDATELVAGIVVFSFYSFSYAYAGEAIQEVRSSGEMR